MFILRILIGLIAIVFIATIAFGQEFDGTISDEELLFPIINSNDDYLPESELGFGDPYGQPYGQQAPQQMQQQMQAPMQPVENTLDFPVPTSIPQPYAQGQKQMLSVPIDMIPRADGQLPNTPQAEQVQPTQTKPQQAQQVEQAFEQMPLQVMPDQESPLEVPLEQTELVQATLPEDVTSFGVLTAADQGFAKDLWQGMSRKRVSEFLDQATDKGVHSPAARRLVLRMLLSETKAPKGEADIDWLAERVEILHKLGMAKSADVLLKASGVQDQGVENFDGMPKVWVANELLAGRSDAACDYVRQHLLNSDDAFWRRALLTCQAVKKDDRGLGLSLDLISMEDRKADPLLFALLDAVAKKGETPRLAPHIKFTALQAAVYGAHTRLLTPDVIIRLPDTVLRKVMQDNALAITFRLQAAEKLVDTYMAEEDVKVLSQLYDVIDFDEKMVKSPSVIEQAQVELDGSMARALLWQAIRHTDLGSTKALTLRSLWQRAEKDGLMNLPGALLPRMRGIMADANLAWFSPYVIQATLKNGNLAEAQNWWNTLKNNRSLSRDLSMKRTDLAVAFSLLDQKLEANVLEAWWAEKEPKVQNNVREVERVLSILEASELTVPASIWQKLHEVANDSYTDQGKGPGAMWLRLLGTALEQKQVGQSLLLLLEPLLYTSPDNMSPDGIANVVTGLRFLGLSDDAKSMVLEALL